MLAARLEAGQALLLAMDSMAGVSARFSTLDALLNTWLGILFNMALIMRSGVRALSGGCSQRSLTQSLLLNHWLLKA